MKKEKVFKVLGVTTIALAAVAGSIYLFQHLPKEEEKKEEHFVITAEDENKKGKDGNYVFENLDDKIPFDYSVFIRPHEEEMQENKCVKELITKAKDAGGYSCYNNGYTYALISPGETDTQTSIEFLNLVEKEDKITMRYAIHSYDTEKATDSIDYFLFRFPTDKEIEFIDRLGYDDVEGAYNLLADYTITDRLGRSTVIEGFEVNEYGELTYNGEYITEDNLPEIEGHDKTKTLTHYRETHNENGDEIDADGNVTKTFEEIVEEEKVLKSVFSGEYLKESYEEAVKDGKINEYVQNIVQQAVEEGKLTFRTMEDVMNEIIAEEEAKAKNNKEETEEVTE